ncbi:hypothetical protein ACVWYH_005062 [Bradyrhizobium sp. GM24.11]
MMNAWWVWAARPSSGQKRFGRCPIRHNFTPTVYERLAMKSVRNFTSFAPYRPVALQNHLKAKAYYETATSGGDHTAASGPGPKPSSPASGAIST